ncbi:MAG TPA: alpha/beta hydrolase [Fimbriiglobus sp.]|nr:alpha/beta hydrolase [Fimbriiglobus sp.]
MSAMRTPGSGFYWEGTAGPPGRALHYVACGAGRPVVFLHGYTDSWFSFRLVLPTLAARARCLAADQRGHGGSACEGDDFSVAALAADAAGFIDELRLGPVALVGHSMGGVVARAVALSRPDLVDRLVLVAAPLRTDTPTLRELKVEVDHFGSTVPRSFAEAFQAACVCDRGSVPGWFFDACVDSSAGVAPRVWRAALAGLLAEDHTTRLGEITCPALVVGGREDGFVQPAEQAELARALPRGRLTLYDGVGHSPHWEQPERFAADVAEFLAALA